MKRRDIKREEKNRWGGRGGERLRARQGRGDMEKRDLFLIDLPCAPRPPSHVITQRIFDLNSLCG